MTDDQPVVREMNLQPSAPSSQPTDEAGVTPEVPTVTLTEAIRIAEERANEDKLDARFERFHADNPHVYRALVKLAREWRAKNPGKPCGVKMLWEVLRWQMMMTTETSEEFRLNNSFTSRYARRIHAQESDLADFFETRELRS